jgi:hypothetical protein
VPLRYAGSASLWGFAIYLASRDGYQDSVLPSGLRAGTPRRRWTAPAGCTSGPRSHGIARSTTVTTGVLDTQVTHHTTRQANGYSGHGMQEVRGFKSPWLHHSRSRRSDGLRLLLSAVEPPGRTVEHSRARRVISGRPSPCQRRWIQGQLRGDAIR